MQSDILHACLASIWAAILQILWTCLTCLDLKAYSLHFALSITFCIEDRVYSGSEFARALMMIFASPFMITSSRPRSLASKIPSSAALAFASSGLIGKRELFTRCPHQSTFFISNYYPYSATTCIFKNCCIYIDLVLAKFRRAPLRSNQRRLLGSDCDWGDALFEFLSIPNCFINYCFRRLVLPLVFV